MAEAMPLSAKPEATATALMVSVEVTEMAPVYFVEAVVGTEPSVVK